ncbi:hypothetical protein Tco_0751541 [Tanacetum coccineum]|uniref:Uncharacterized protein n=1 Tax=Tanacetum coccineum TaxID=301880 RepID=A0ABQ4Z7F6_9ASTR
MGAISGVYSNRCLFWKQDSSQDTVRHLILQILWGIIHSANLDFASLIWDEFEWKTVERLSKPLKMYKLLYTHFTKLIIDYLLSLNKSIPRRSESNDAIKKKAGYKYYMAKKVESKKAKIVDKPEEQHVSPVKSGRGKGFNCYGDQVANVPNKLKKDVVPRKTKSLTIAEETDVGQKLKGPAVEDPAIQSLLDLRKGSKASRLENLRQKKQPVTGEGSSAYNKYYSSSDTASDATLYSSSSDKPEGSANETDDADEYDMDLSDDNPHRYDDDARYGVFMHNKSTATPNSTYLNSTITSSSLDFIQTLIDETPTNELMDFMSHTVYTDARTTSVVHNPKGNPELTRYISEWFPKKSGLAKRRTTWFDLFLKSDIDKDENHILGPSTVAIAKNFKEIIQKDELSIADLKGA